MSDDREKFVENINTEYYKITSIVSDYDKNILTVKSWGVTLSAAALAWGFQQQHYGLFLVACLSSIAFWLIETVMKYHQMRYYIRMREIEVINSEFSREILTDGNKISTPAIDWSWQKGSNFSNEQKNKYKWELPKNEPQNPSFIIVMFYLHVFLPHLINAIAGGVLFYLGYSGRLNNMPL